MPSAAARRIYEDQLPSFMTVFDLDADAVADRDIVTLVDTNHLMGVGSKPVSCAAPTLSQATATTATATATASRGRSHHHQQPQTQLHQHQQKSFLKPQPLPDHSHRYHDSTSTRASESADSSPTTTLSTADSSPLSDPSPSSPDSSSKLPALIPLNNYPSTSFGRITPEMASLTVRGRDHGVAAAASAGEIERPMTSPAPRRPRNMKGLFIQPPSLVSNQMAALVPDPAPPVKPPSPHQPPVKRKPSLLTLKTNACDLVARNHHQEVPSSPGVPPILQRRALKHSTSTPHMLSGLKSCTFAPAGGMTFPKVLERNESGLSEVLRPLKSNVNTSFDGTIHEEESPIKPQMASRAQLDRAPYVEQENNEDQKSPGYPEGPVAIYGDSVFLYKEPTAEEASRFDLVINVAYEVPNPFRAEQQQREGPDAIQGSSRRPLTIVELPTPVPDTAMTDASFATAFEQLPDDNDDDDDDDHDDEFGRAMPKTMREGMDGNTPREPEYVHVPWDHHTNIAPDLMSLCEKIESRVGDGKKVLVHCQQGASRSASLIIAYGLYLNPDLTVNDAYYTAQAKSRWISPNMKLMYSLQDFQKEVSARKKVPSSSFRRQRTGRSPPKHNLSLSADATASPSSSPRAPRTAPLPGNNGTSYDAGDDGDSEISENSAGLPSLVDGGDDPSSSSSSASSSSRGRTRGMASPPNGRTISPGPSSAPSGLSWPGYRTEEFPREMAPPRFHLDGDGYVSVVDKHQHLVPEPLRAHGFDHVGPPPTPGFPGSGFPSFRTTHRPNFDRMEPPPTPGFSGPGFPSFQTTRQPIFERLGPFPTHASSTVAPRQPKTSFFIDSSSSSSSSSPSSSSFAPPPRIDGGRGGHGDADDYGGLMSPRVETMIHHPFRDAFEAAPAAPVLGRPAPVPVLANNFSGARLAELPPTPTDFGALLSPSISARQPIFPFARPIQAADPRSPAVAGGGAQIVRSIDELL